MTQEPHHPDNRETRAGVTSEPELLTGPGGPEPTRSPLRRLWQHRSARGRAVVAAATVGVLALGGTVAFAATSEDSGGGTPSPSPSSSDGTSDSRHGRGMWFGLGGGAVHGEATVRDPDSDDWVVRVWQRGTVEKVDGDRVTVKSEDGTSWTWTVDSDTTVLRDGDSDSGADALKKDDTVVVTGIRSGDTRTADRVASGTFEGKSRGERRGGGLPGFGHGHRWGNGDTASPDPSEKGDKGGRSEKDATRAGA
ncbi:hypothetical protein [Streptomyces sp. NPDC018693]|uniref:hypothetical protein n=1 Tax=unclassified Streptomyces TaxID=2593676 RepID=UPI0037ADF009